MNKVFISYVSENIEIVKRLYQELKAHGIQVWLDQNDIDPGSRWEQAIRKAIHQGAFFIACFSEEYNNRDKTYMNEELTLAIDELRQLPTDQIWFIPVKLNDCEIPDRDIGGGKTLRALQYVNLYEDWDVNLQRILTVVQARLSEPVINVSTAEQREVEAQPQDANAYFDRGNVYRSKGDYDRAIEAFNTATDLNPDFAGAYNHRGVVYLDKGDYDCAIADFTTAIDLNPDFVDEAYYNRGLAYHKKGEIDKALKDYTKAIDLNPDFVDEAYYNRGLAYHKKGEIDKALKDYTKAIDLNPKFVDEVYYNRGRIWLYLREWEKAKSDLMSAKEKGRNIITTFRNDYRSVGDFERIKGIRLPTDIAIMLTPQQ